MAHDQARMQEIAKELSSKSEKIRALAKVGYRRTEIAAFMGVRYQFVRNVLVEEERRTQHKAKSSAAKYGRQHPADLSSHTQPAPTRLRIDADGNMSIPKEFREALSLENGGALIASVQDGELRLMTMSAAVRRAQAIVRQFVPEGVSLVDELIADRRKEVAREAQRG